MAVLGTVLAHQMVLLQIGTDAIAMATVVVLVMVVVVIVAPTINYHTVSTRTFREEPFRAAAIVQTTTLAAADSVLVLMWRLIRRRYNATIIHVVVVDHLAVDERALVRQLLLVLVLLLVLLMVGHVMHVVLLYQHIVTVRTRRAHVSRYHHDGWTRYVRGATTTTAVRLNVVQFARRRLSQTGGRRGITDRPTVTIIATIAIHALLGQFYARRARPSGVVNPRVRCVLRLLVMENLLLLLLR